MLVNHSPLKVAEQFMQLEAMAPGRIDLGVGRAPGTDGRTAYALQRDRRERAPDDFPQQLAELLAYLDDRMPEDHPFATLARTLPGRPDVPAPWLLGSSPDSANWAAETGLPYCIADFINPQGVPLAHRYRSGFQALESRNLSAPYLMAAVWVICADTDAEAERLAASSLMLFRLLHRGELIAVPTPEDALRFLERDPPTGAPGATRRRRMILGTPETVRAGIEAVAAEYGPDEIMIVNIMHDHDARRRSYALIAEAFGLAASDATEPNAVFV
jgi:luciferase family oxidoreductase group 1